MSYREGIGIGLDSAIGGFDVIGFEGRLPNEHSVKDDSK